jgi:hypothetical protein
VLELAEQMDVLPLMGPGVAGADKQNLKMTPRSLVPPWKVIPCMEVPSEIRDP